MTVDLCRVKGCENPKPNGRTVCRKCRSRKEKTGSFHLNVVTDEERFLSNTKKTDSCWLWLGATNSKGYGRVGMKGKVVGAHRYSYEIHKESIPDGLHVLHACDVRHCVNPSHLFLGTNKENVNDRVRKNRGANTLGFGEGHKNSKLSDKDASDIRLMLSRGYTGYQLAKKYSVNCQNIYNIRDRKIWKHLE